MRRTLVTSGLAGLLTLAVCFAIASAKSPEQAKSKSRAAKSGKMETAGRGNADSITEEELKSTSTSSPPTNWKAATCLRAGSIPPPSTSPATSPSGDSSPAAAHPNTNGPLQPYFMPMELVAKTCRRRRDSKASHRGCRDSAAVVAAEEAVDRGGAELPLARAPRFRIRARMDRDRRRPRRRRLSNPLTSAANWSSPATATSIEKTKIDPV